MSNENYLEVPWIKAVCDADFRTIAAVHAPLLIEVFGRYTLERAEMAYNKRQKQKEETT